MHFGNDTAMFLVFTKNSVLFVVKRVKPLRFDDLAIARGVNIFANCFKDQFAHLVAQYAVMASTFGGQTKSHWGLSESLTKLM